MPIRVIVGNDPGDEDDGKNRVVTPLFRRAASDAVIPNSAPPAIDRSTYDFGAPVEGDDLGDAAAFVIGR